MQLVITPGGAVRAIYSEVIDLAALGSPAISRASHVEPDQQGRWWADMSPVGGGTLDVSQGNTTLSVSGAIGGSGVLTKNGPGTLALAGSNNFSGGVTISAGMIASCSKVLAQMPMMKPNRLNATEVSRRKTIIHNGCRICNGTNSVALFYYPASVAADLAGNVPAHAGVRQGVHHFGHAGGKPPQSI